MVPHFTSLVHLRRRKEDRGTRQRRSTPAEVPEIFRHSGASPLLPGMIFRRSPRGMAADGGCSPCTDRTTQNWGAARVGRNPAFALALARSKSAGQHGPWLFQSPLKQRSGRGKARRVSGMARAWMPELRQRRSSCPMPASLASAQATAWMPELRQCRMQLPDVLSTNPAARPRTFRAQARKARKRGGLLFGHFLLATQEKVARPPKEGEMLLILSSCSGKSAPRERPRRKPTQA
jgi:hypothetical protein